MSNVLVKLKADLSINIHSKSNECKEQLELYFDTSNHKEIIDQWRANKLIVFAWASTNLTEKTLEELEKFWQSLDLMFLQSEQGKEHCEQILKKAAALAEELQGKDVKKEYVTKEFDKIWGLWAAEFTQKRIVDKSICDSIRNCMDTHAQEYKVLIKEKLESQPLEDTFNCKCLENSYTLSDIDEKEHFMITDNCRSIEDIGNNFMQNLPKTWYESYAHAGATVNTFESNKSKQLIVQCKKQVLEIVNQIFIDIDLWLTEIFSQNATYLDHHVINIIHIVTETIKDHNHRASPDYPFTISQTLLVKVLLHVCRFALQKFQQLKEDYNKVHGVQAMLENYREKVWEIFKNKVEETINEVSAGRLFWMCLKDWLKNYVHAELETNYTN